MEKAELTTGFPRLNVTLPAGQRPSQCNGGDSSIRWRAQHCFGLQNIVRKVYVEVVERNNELAALRNYTTGAPVVAATTKSLQEGARVRTAG